MKINTDAELVNIDGINGLLILLYLTLDPEVYNTQLLIIFIPPVKPGKNPTIPSISTGHQINKIQRQKFRL